MVFASRRAFIDIQHVYDILREDHYRNISMSNVDIGDVVVYERNGLPEHVGIIIEIDRTTFGTEAEYVILSKWGQYAEFIHPLKSVPEAFGVPTRFYTDRVLGNEQ